MLFRSTIGPPPVELYRGVLTQNCSFQNQVFLEGVEALFRSFRINGCREQPQRGFWNAGRKHVNLHPSTFHLNQVWGRKEGTSLCKRLISRIADYWAACTACAPAAIVFSPKSVRPRPIMTSLWNNSAIPILFNSGFVGR
jgi:hypothetical protein